MKSYYSPSVRKTSRGVATLELAIIFPLLLLMLLGAIEIGRLLQANLIIGNLSREGANLAARSQESRQVIMQLLAETASPLDMASNGMIYLTIVDGHEDGPLVADQVRWTGGGFATPSRVWNDCGAWSAGTCTSPGEESPLLPAPLSLSIGERVYMVEALYDFQPIVNFAFVNQPVIYSLTVF